MADRQLRLERELQILGQLSEQGCVAEQGSKESAQVLGELWDHVEDELVSCFAAQAETLPRLSVVPPGEVVQLVDDTAELEEELLRLRSQPFWKRSLTVPPFPAALKPVSSESNAPAFKKASVVEACEAHAAAPACNPVTFPNPGQSHARNESRESDIGVEAAARAGHVSSFRSAADLFPEVAHKSQPQPCTLKKQQEFDDVSQSILKRDSKCRAPKRLADGSDKLQREWSDAWLRIADADQLERLVPALEATIHRTDADAVQKEDIAGLSFVKAQIEEVLILPRLHPELFLSALTKPARGLLLFGPPGTGKTLLAKWIAAECGATFFNINASSVMSKWIGEAEKTVKALFQLAADRQPSVIFLDEIDSLLSQRRDADNEASRRVKNEFLTSLEGAETAADEKILCVGATNMPWDLDHAVLRRLPKRLYVPLPGRRARRSLLVAQLAKHNSKVGLQGDMSASDIDYVVEHTEGFSCSDLQQLLCEAAMGPVREVAAARLRHSGDSTAHRGPRDIARHDFDCALRRVKPTHNAEQGRRHRAFNDEHGTCRGEDAMQDTEGDD
ncbi:spas-1 [Symbiodinium necroappetens]|uniref:Spas-1 protein n=1 Tax=Symbiodinium necroappetens TaxID=1628268 RepID=A0A812YYN1_9DINO|nr:spas-1 [Symbiodinium necroappetens]